MKITDMFEESANFSTLFPGEHVKMSDVIQKVFFGIDSSSYSDCSKKNSEGEYAKIAIYLSEIIFFIQNVKALILNDDFFF